MTDLLDQSPLLALAERLVDAARKAGADAADAVAVRVGVALGRGARRRGRGDRALRRRRPRPARAGRQAAGGGLDQRPQGQRRRCARRARGRDGAGRARGQISPGLADAALLAHSFPDLDLLDPMLPDVAAARDSARARPKPPRLRVKGVAKSGGASASAGIGGMVLVTSHGFRGAYVGSRHCSPRWRSPAKAPAWSATTISPPRCTPPTWRTPADDRPQRRRARGEAAQSAQGRDAARAGGVRSARRRLAGRASRLGDQRRLDRAQDQLPEGPHGRAAVSPRASASSTIRCASAACARIPSTAKASPGSALARDRGRRAEVLVPRLGDRARACRLRPPAMRRAACRRRPRRRRPTCISKPASDSPQELIADIKDGFYVTDLIGMGANLVTGDYSRGASGFWIENGELTYPVSEVTIAGHLNDMFASLEPANDLDIPLRHQRADRARGRTDRCGHLSQRYAPRSRTSSRPSCAKPARWR